MFRAKKLLELMRECPCASCGAEDGTVVAAHFNDIEFKSLGMKSPDWAVCALCHRCHGEYDQGRSMQKWERKEFWLRCFLKTQGHLWETKKICIR